VIVAALAEVAPDADLAALDPAADLVQQLELDSMDFLNVVDAVNEATGVALPERDYPQLATLEGFAAYLASRWPTTDDAGRQG
jgi:acyl carrier protein